MKLDKLKKDLEWRGLLKDIANEEYLEDILSEEGKFYIGIDPTADSIHVGHFLSLSLSKILNSHGLKPILVIGGFTGMIGDPSGRNSEREIISKTQIMSNVESIKKQLIELSKKMNIKNIEVFDNSDIYSSMSIIDLYQNFGKLFNINTMLAKESVKNRIENGISYTEFSYQMFQAIDFFTLNKEKGVTLQIGGSDQWGNITAGIELIRKVSGIDKKISGITINLLTDENGNKIGKSQGKPMWLDKNKTSPYTLFQYFINLNDDIAKKLLAQATNISEEEFNECVEISIQEPRKKAIQNELAKRFISVVHSEKDFDNSFKLSKLLFEEKYYEINNEQIELLNNIPSINYEDEILMDLLVDNKFISSRREYRELLSNNAIKINGTPISSQNFKITNEFILDKVVFLNIGKKNKYIIIK